jgi:hypothetical protein
VRRSSLIVVVDLIGLKGFVVAERVAALYAAIV